MIKIFGDKKIKIRKLVLSDLKRAKEFQKYVNSLIEEDAPILMNRKLSLKREKEFLSGMLKEIKEGKRTTLLLEHNNKIIGLSSVALERWKSDHVGRFNISIKNGYRGLGLGRYLMEEVIKLAKNKLASRLKIIKLEVFCDNQPAIKLYKKLGFKQVAKIPKQLRCRGKLIDELVMLLYL